MAPWIRTTVAALAAVANRRPAPTIVDGFSNATLDLIKANMLSIAEASWEIGTAAEALTELSWQSLSVFNKTAFPPPSRLPKATNASDVLKIVDDVLAEKEEDIGPLFNNQGSAADPASLGVAVLLANWTRSNKDDETYADAAQAQLNYLLDDAPRSESGAISHRANEVQLWADFIYMVPPFIAYYGALQDDKAGIQLLQTSFEQIKLYRDALRDENGLWRHITLGNWTDDTHWATGNAWAAAGMLRVLKTMNHSSHAEHFKTQQTNLTDWIHEITEASWAHQGPNGTLFNVIDDSSTFADSASTALIAAVTYRMATFTKNTTQISCADKAFGLIQDSVDEDGWLTQTVDPYTFSTPSKPGEHSPEGQAFTLLLEAAWREYADYVEEWETKESKKGQFVERL